MPRKSKKLVESPVSSSPAADTTTPDQTPAAPTASQPAKEDRDAAGRYLPNNAGGPGNPHARHCARMLELFRSAITDEEMYVLCRILFERASTGDMSAMKMVWQYKLGKPLPAPNPDAIDRNEWDHFQKDAMTLDEMKKVLNQLPSRIGNAIVSAALPSIAESVSQTLAAQLFQSLPADYYAQPTTSPDAQTQPATTSSAPSAAPDSQEADPISNGFSSKTNPISNGFLPELDADGLPSRNLPPSLPTRAPATRQAPSAKRSAPIPNGKSNTGGKAKKARKGLKNQRMEPIAKKCPAPKKSQRQRVHA